MIPSPRRDDPGRLWSLLDMLRVYAERFVEASKLLALVSANLREVDGAEAIDLSRTSQQPSSLRFRDELEQLRGECEQLDCRLTVKHINRLLSIGKPPAKDVRAFVDEISTRYRDELTMRSCFVLSPERAGWYETPLDKWEGVVQRFGCAFDVEEARKCFAVERYTACVFHLMKVVEAAVLELQVFLGQEDVKAHFGSVLSKLEQFTQKTKIEDVPSHLQPYYGFMRIPLIVISLSTPS